MRDLTFTDDEEKLIIYKMDAKFYFIKFCKVKLKINSLVMKTLL